MKLAFAFWFLLETYPAGDIKLQVVGPFDTKAQCEKIAAPYLHGPPSSNGMVHFGPSASAKPVDGELCWFTRKSVKP